MVTQEKRKILEVFFFFFFKILWSFKKKIKILGNYYFEIHDSMMMLVLTQRAIFHELLKKITYCFETYEVRNRTLQTVCKLELKIKKYG